MKFKLIEIKKIERENYSGPVHDLTVKKNHSYNVFNIICHNSICSTRMQTGFGVPLLTTLEDCAMIRDTAYIIADGGVKYNGDIAKAISFGADFIQTGRMFAGTDLAPGDCYSEQKVFICEYNKMNELTKEERKYVKYKKYQGMASKEARSGVLKDSSVEGVSGLIPYTGSTEDFIHNLKNNLKASLSYGGSYNWREFRRNVKKIRISPAAWNESLTHIEGM